MKWVTESLWKGSVYCSRVMKVMAAGLVLGPCPETLFGFCRPVNDINYQPTNLNLNLNLNSDLQEYDAS